MAKMTFFHEQWQRWNLAAPFSTRDGRDNLCNGIMHTHLTTLICHLAIIAFSVHWRNPFVEQGLKMTKKWRKFSIPDRTRAVQPPTKPFVAWCIFLSFSVIYPPQCRTYTSRDLQPKCPWVRCLLGEQQTVDQNTKQIQKGGPPWICGQHNVKVTSRVNTGQTQDTN